MSALLHLCAAIWYTRSMIDIHLQAGEPEYLQIVQQVRWAVANGELKTGDTLEPVRRLAARLGVNASTVARAYRLLEMQGVVHTHQRRGTIIAAPGADVQDLRHTRLRQIMERALVEALALGYTPGEVEGAFAMQIAAWRERRARPFAAGRPPSAGDRLHRFAGSHDLALEALWAYALRAEGSDAFSASYVGSLDGMLQLLRGDVAIAGTHMLDEESGEYNLPILQRLFVGRRLAVVTLAEREQGLIVAAGNPARIDGLATLAQPHVRFINRQPGSGTRTLLDYHLRRQGIAATAISGYQHEVATHTAVADAVARGRADAGLGLRAAAHAFGLSFIPLARERYDLVMLADDRMQPPLARLIDCLCSAAFREIVAGMIGYDATHTGRATLLG